MHARLKSDIEQLEDSIEKNETPIKRNKRIKLKIILDSKLVSLLQ